MTAPIWQTEAGSLGTYSTNAPLKIGLSAWPALPATHIKYKLISGSLPDGVANTLITLDESGGYILGTPKNIILETSYTFTVRAVDELNNFRDRTFTLTLVGANSPKFTTSPGEILHITDSEYVDTQLHYSNPVIENEVIVSLASGTLPPGLRLSPAGRITGYAKPPVLLNGSPTTKTYTFTVQLYSPQGVDSATYGIVIKNQRLTNPPNSRRPVILNLHPLTLPLSATDNLYEYYLGSDGLLPDFTTGDFFSFKVIGHDFDNSDITYKYLKLPPGLSGDVKTGWITGNPVLPAVGIIRYEFSVAVEKTNRPSISSSLHTFTVNIINGLSQDVTWNTPADLGVINNATVSLLKVEAYSAQELNYRIVSGSLPTPLTLLPTGEIVGKVASQPTTKLLPEGSTSKYVCSIMAYSPQYPLLRSTRQFTITVYQKFPAPLENIYVKASGNIAGRKVLKSLLTDESLIPTEYLYRPKDPYFGKATDVRYVHSYGMTAADIETYTAAIQQSHYERNIILGAIKTAVARDENSKIIYEIVYSEIIDDLTNDKGTSIPKQITWPRPISLKKGPWTVNNTDIRISYNKYTTNLSPGTTNKLYPASLNNMRSEIVNTIGQTGDIDLIPKWMYSQQLNGDTIGYIQAWVICYAIPGYGQTIVDNINNNWPHTLNEIEFVVDRYIVDKSASYNWNTYLSIPAWSELPSAYPVPDPLDTHDMPVLFPRKTIMPPDSGQ